MEKRRDNRIKKKLPVRFYYEGTAFHSVTADMSRRGIFIETLHPCPPGKGINIEIDGNPSPLDLRNKLSRVFVEHAAIEHALQNNEGVINDRGYGPHHDHSVLG